MTRVGILGGTFDPPHIGHLVAVQDVLERAHLDRVVLVPAALPPHKPGTPPTEGAIRLRMLEAAIGGDSRFDVSTVELDRGGTSFTVDTLREFTRTHPRLEFCLVIGADLFEGFQTWREPQEVARLAELIVMTREGLTSLDPPNGLEVKWKAVPVTRVDVSSTLIRTRLREGRSVRYLVPEGVRRIIEAESLYVDPGYERSAHEMRDVSERC